ncbi:MAG: phosphoribosylformylglycinamidine synthase subunit PurL [Chloroflexaceae bacterium]|nr:phosphoribosylformylglycinamidine synthase subunit PurL [Chloroflexaceae bacterium]
MNHQTPCWIEITRRHEATMNQRVAPYRISPWIETAHLMGINQLQQCEVRRLFFVQGDLSLQQVQQIATELLTDPVTETCTVGQGLAPITVVDSAVVAQHCIDVTLLPGVTDSVAEHLVDAIRLTYGSEHAQVQVATGQRYLLVGDLSAAELEQLAVTVFANPVIQRWAIDQPIEPHFLVAQLADATVERIPLRLADAQSLLLLSRQRRLALDLAEMQAIQTYFVAEGRDPTDAELEMLAQTWSEHCVHKTFKALIQYDGPQPGDTSADIQPQVIDGLLRRYLRAATEQLKRPWVRSAFVDNAGIIAFDDHWDLAFKVETHNHPSALEPFGGANTGVGGVVRDVLGVSARPIANTNVLCFGPTDIPLEALPSGVLHPHRVAAGVISGIEDYGNKMGIPTVNGAVYYHPGYTANPLVFCGCLGMLPRGSHPTAPQDGDLIVVLGGRTGRDGLRGATFSSMEMDQTTSTVAGSAVQIGHPINEKQVLEVVLQARDERLYHAITDCGAGGLSSAIGEMGRHMGADVQLTDVPLKYTGLRPWEIWLSEAQERMVLAIPADKWIQFQAICIRHAIEAVAIGVFTATGRLQLWYAQQRVADLDMDFLHDGLPRRELAAMWQPAASVVAARAEAYGLAGHSMRSHGVMANLSQTLLALLAHPNICSREPIVRRYDHEVQGGTAVKPLVGASDHGPGDATVLVPLDYQAQPNRANQPLRGVALSVGLGPMYGEWDPYAMAWAAIDEALRNIVCVGADPDQVAILDNFCWGNPNLPDRLGSLVRCAQGCYDAAMAYGTPFISGKDSLNNEYTSGDGTRHAIPGTLVISALGIVPDVTHTVTMDLKQPGDWLYIVGTTRAELGGSHYQWLYTEPGEAETSLPGCHQPPQPVPQALTIMRQLHRAIAQGLVQACHDCAEGGIGVALAEMCLAGEFGADVMLHSLPGAFDDQGKQQLDDDIALFAESLCRFLVEVRPAHAEAFEALLAGLPYARIGQVSQTDELSMTGCSGKQIVHVLLNELETTWRGLDQDSELYPANPRPRREPVKPPVLPHLPVAPRVLVLHVTGTNRDREAALACSLAGGNVEIVHINQLLAGERQLLDYHMLVLPGGFSYGDDLGAGTLWALDIRHRVGTAMAQFVESGRPVLGICNGFQALIKAGLLPGRDLTRAHQRAVTLTNNASQRFECRWVYLRPNPGSPAVFTAGLSGMIYCPVAHSEGRVAVHTDEALDVLESQHLIALTYAEVNHEPGLYPANPNGSVLGIAGLCNPAGNVLGLMPHPEDHIFPWQHPRWHRGEQGMTGLHLFRRGIEYARR